MELFADFHPIFSNQNLHCLDSDKILSCEVYNVVQTTASKLVKDDVSALKSDKIYDNLYPDEKKNLLVTLGDPFSGEHRQLLKEKIAWNNTLNTIKDNLLSTKRNIF